MDNSSNRDLFYTGAFNQNLNIDMSLLEEDSFDNIILKTLKTEVGNKCIRHGYIKIDSINIIKRTIGTINSSRLDGSINYDISYSADVCCPTKGQIIECEVKNKNKMGIMAEKKPIIVVVARKNNETDEFSNYDIGDKIKIQIVGSRFDLYDDTITAIGDIVD